MEKIIDSPFKFLDPYKREDYDIFFGRDEEVKQLYQHIHKNRLVLVYGTSGTGKTSIVQCGLMNRMDDTDWVPLFIRRAENINESLCTVLQQTLPSKETPPPNASGTLQATTIWPQPSMPLLKTKAPDPDTGKTISELLQQINLRYLRPVYLIFDQFEELLIMGSEDEKQTFIHTIDMILSRSELQFCNLLFIMREEFFAGLSEFEKEIPDFCNRRLRIEPMNEKNVIQVITRSCEKFSITLKEGEENARQIMNIVKERNTVQLPYLQIYLDQLWHSRYFSSAAWITQGNDPYPPLTFSSVIIQNFGGMSEVLDRFMSDRISVIQGALQKEFPDIPEDFMSNVLDAFVTPEGTKKPLTYMSVNNQIWFTGQVPAYLQNRPGDLMVKCFDELERSKILRKDGQTYELAHDVLAGLIDSRRTEEQRKANFIDQQIRSRYKGYQENTSGYLSAKELDAYRSYVTQLNLPAEIMDFYHASVKEREEEEEADREREAQLRSLQRMRRLKRWGAVGLAALFLLSTILYFYTNNLRRDYNRTMSMLFMCYQIDTIRNPVEALNMFPFIKGKVFNTDTMNVNMRLLEFMQTQGLQSRFSIFTDTLPTSLIRQNDIDISDNGKFIVYGVSFQNIRDNTTNAKFNIYSSSLQNPQDNTTHFILLNDAGAQMKTFKRRSYVYFMNRDNTLLVYSRKKDPVSPSFASRLEKSQQANDVDTLHPSEFYLHNCSTGRGIKFVLGHREFLYPPEDIAPGPFSEFDSHRVRFTASGNLIIPYQKIDKKGNMQDKIRILSPDSIPLLDSVVALASTITTSRDLKKLLLLCERDNGASFVLKLYSEHGNLLRQLPNVIFADFTTEGTLIWGDEHNVKVSQEGNPLTFPTRYPLYYAYGSLDKKRIITRETPSDYINEAIGLINTDNGTQQYFFGNLMAADFDNDVFLLQTTGSKDTIWRRDLNGKPTCDHYISPEGIDTWQYNRKSGEILLYTKKNRLILLNRNLQVKTGLQLTPNDRYGLSRDAGILYYARDQYLSVFHNSLNYLDVFDANKAWQLLATGHSPINMQISKQRRKELGLRYR